MTAIAEAGTQSKPQAYTEPSRGGVRCAIYCSDSSAVLGYLVRGKTTTCLEQALTRNGFSVVPVGSRRPKTEQALVAA